MTDRELCGSYEVLAPPPWDEEVSSNLVLVCLSGNVACDEELGGRLIFYDFGMMDEFQPSVRSGLVNLIFSTYENDPRAVCDALVEMGILRENADRIRWVSPVILGGTHTLHGRRS